MAAKSLPIQYPPSKHPLITSITKVLNSLNPKSHSLIPTTPKSPQYIPSLTQFSPHLTPSFVIKTIKFQTNPYQALLFFNWASMPHPNPVNYSHTFPCYLVMYKVLLYHKLFTTATQFMELNNMVNDASFAKLIRAYGDYGNFRGAIDVFYKAKNLLHDGDCVKSFNVLLGILVKSNKIDLCQDVFNQVVNEGVVKLDVMSYTKMIRGYVKMGMIEDAQKVFDERPESCRPNVFLYNTLVCGYCKKGMMVNARQIVDKMIMSGGDSLPDMVTYSTLIDGYCKKGEMVEALRCFDEMIKQGCEPNLVTYNTIVNGFCLVGEVEEAKRIMYLMSLSGIKVDVATHTSLLKGLCVVGKIDDAIKHIKDMISLGINPDIKSYGVLVNEFCKLGKAKEAIDLMRDMIERGIWPGVTMYNALLKVYTERGEIDDAVLLLKGMPDLYITPNFLSYFTVLYGLCEAESRAEEVEELLHRMIRDGHKPDAALYRCVMKMYCKHGDLKMAAQFFCESVKAGYAIDLDNFAVYMEELCAKRNFLEDKEHVQEMIETCIVARLDDHQRVLNKLICKQNISTLQDIVLKK